MAKVRVKSKQFIYETRLKWKGGREGLLTSGDNKPPIEVSVPPEFKGCSGLWTPEALLVASVNICVMTTFLYYAEKKIELLSYESSARGILERVEDKFMFSTIEVKPQILVASKDDVEKAQSLLELSEKNCFISNSLKSRVILKTEIRVDS